MADEVMSRILQLSPEEVKQGYMEGIIEPGEVDEYTTVNEIKAGRYHDLPPDMIKLALEKGHLTPEQADNYILRQEHPVAFHVRDIFWKAPIHGVRDAAQNMLTNWERFMGWALDMEEPLRNELPQADAPETLVGGLVSTGVQFGSAFVPGLGAVGKGRKVLGILQNAPKLAAFLEATVASAGATAAVMDPYEERLSNLASEHWSLIAPMTDYLKAEESDPRPLAIFKNVVETELLGLGILGAGKAAVKVSGLVVDAAKLIKSRIWTKNHNVAADVAEEVGESFEKLMQKYGKDTGFAAESDELAAAAGKTSAEIAADVTPEVAATPGKMTRKTSAGSPEHTYFEAEEAMHYQLAEKMVKVAKGEIPGPELTEGLEHFNITKFMDEPEEGLKFMDMLSDFIEAEKVSFPQQDKEATALMESWLGKGASIQKMAQAFSRTAYEARLMSRSLDMMFKAEMDALAQMANKATTPEQFLKVHELILKHGDLQAAIKSGQSDIARALGAKRLMRTLPEGLPFDMSTLPADMLEMVWKDKGSSVIKFVKEFGKAADPKARAKLARAYNGNRVSEGILEFVQANLLWGYMTQVKNLVGTFSNFVWDATNLAIGVGAAKIRTPELEAGKVLGLYMSGLKQGLVEAFSLSNRAEWAKVAQSYRSGGFKEALNQVEVTKGLGNVWKAAASGQSQIDTLGKVTANHDGIIPNIGKFPLGDIIRFPFRFLTAADEGFKNLGYHAYKNVMAFEDAFYTQSLRGEQLTAKVRHLVENLPEELHMKALTKAREITFTEPLKGKQKAISDFLNGYKDSSPGAKVFGPLAKALFIPFETVIFNIGNLGVRSTPLGLLSRSVQADFTAGGIRATQAAARMATGTGLIALGMTLYEDGKIKGRIPKELRTTAHDAGIQEYSYFSEEDQQWKSFDGLDPLFAPIILGADLRMLWDYGKVETTNKQKDFNQLVFAAIATVGEGLTRQSWAEGMHDAMRLMFEPEKLGVGKWATKQVSKVVPLSGALRDLNRYRDDTVREIGDALKDWHALADAFITPFTGTDKLLPKRHPVYGHEIHREDRTWYGGNALSMSKDPAMLEMARLNMETKPMDDMITVGKGSTRMTPEEHNHAESLLAQPMGNAGKLQDTLNALVTSPAYQKIANSPEDAKALLNKIIGTYRNAAKATVLAKSPERVKELQDKLQLRKDAIMGVYLSENPTSLTNHLRTYIQTRE